MKKFSLVSKTDLDKIKASNIKGLSPDRQIKALRLWTDQNIKKYGPCGTKNEDAEMQKFIADAAEYFGINSTSLAFQRDLKAQRGWGAEWKAKVFDKNGDAIDVDSHGLLRDNTLKGVIAKIIQDNGAGHHGNTILSGDHGECLHWRSGSLRVFADYDKRTGLKLIGIGRHSGSGNSSYRLDLILGGTATAETG